MEKFFAQIRRKNKPEMITDSVTTPYLLAGLGNPGREYRDSRHNYGFMVVDRIAQELGIEFKKSQSKALIAISSYQGKRVILAKPQTFMNLSGQAVIPLLKYYKIAVDHLLVIHDDLDLPFGALRMRPGGGAGGQKGLNSIIHQLGHQDFARLRCGIDHPTGQMDVSDYVLSRFSKDEESRLQELLDKAAAAALAFVDKGIQDAMTRYNGVIAD